jgi:hypothetical protein
VSFGLSDVNRSGGGFEGDAVSEGGEPSDDSFGLGAGFVVSCPPVDAEIVVVDVFGVDVPDGDDDRVRDRDERLLLADASDDSPERTDSRVFLVRAAADAACTSASASHGFDGFVRPERCSLADSLLPGQIPHHDAR